jgi:hypothetical protein
VRENVRRSNISAEMKKKLQQLGHNYICHEYEFGK